MKCHEEVRETREACFCFGNSGVSHVPSVENIAANLITHLYIVKYPTPQLQDIAVIPNLILCTSNVLPQDSQLYNQKHIAPQTPSEAVAQIISNT